MKSSHPALFPGLVSFWDFQEAEGNPHLAQGPCPYALIERGGKVPVIEKTDGPFGSRAVSFGQGPWLEVPRKLGPGLDIHGPDATVSVMAWIRRFPFRPEHEGQCEAVAGVWNEHGRRQYGLFLNLRIHDSFQQVGAHISSVGGPTPGYKYCMDAAIGATAVPPDSWQCAAITYDGVYACSYLNGKLDARGDRNPYFYPGGIFGGGEKGGDFTVGAVARPDTVEMLDGKLVEGSGIQSNLYRGLLGGLAVYRRALSGEEIGLLVGNGANKP